MDDQYALARYLKEYREAKGLNHRQLADLIREHGGSAKTQAVQQWENLDPEQRTTRPSQQNRILLAEILDCDAGELEHVYERAKRAAGALRGRATRGSAPIEPLYSEGSLRRIKIRVPGLVVTQLIERRLLEREPSLADCMRQTVEIFHARKRFDFLASTLAAEWVSAPAQTPSFNLTLIESALWRLDWLARLDKQMNVKRRYLLILVLTDVTELDHADLESLDRRTDRMRLSLVNELRMVESSIDIFVAPGPEHAADRLVDEAGPRVRA